MYQAANNQKIPDKKKADYQEGLEKSRADSAARSHGREGGEFRWGNNDSTFNNCNFTNNYY